MRLNDLVLSMFTSTYNADIFLYITWTQSHDFESTNFANQNGQESYDAAIFAKV